ncbi:MAG TPA: hypothetical protein VMU76_02575 [Acidimicrobiales bacterium]|nr:hypothetical protein [Acidimicrobiales bacterium]
MATFAFLGPAFGSAPAPPTKGAIPASAAAHGAIDWSQAPDYVSVTSNGRIVGYVNKTALIPTPLGQPVRGQAPSSPEVPPPLASRPQLPIVTVYGPDLVTVVGHEYPGKGFVPLGTDAGAIPPAAQAVSQSPPPGS